MDKYFRTNNFYLAVFLFAKGLELANIDRTDTKRCNFIFIDTAERETLLGAFNFGKENCHEALIDARKMIFAVKTLKDKLYQEF